VKKELDILSLILGDDELNILTYVLREYELNVITLAFSWFRVMMTLILNLCLLSFQVNMLKCLLSFRVVEKRLLSLTK